MVQKSLEKPSVGMYLNCLDFLLYIRRQQAKKNGKVDQCVLDTLKLLEFWCPAFVPNLTKLITDRYNR